MDGKRHHYQAALNWSSTTTGPLIYQAYNRGHSIKVDGKPELTLSADPAFRGSRDCLNPEELLLAALSSCHLLCFLARAAQIGLDVRHYRDSASGVMIENRRGGGAFSAVTLRPDVTFGAGVETDAARFGALHHQAAKDCFIAASVNFPVRHEPTFRLLADPAS